MKKKLFILGAFVIVTQVIQAQSSFPAFAKEIAAFKKQDSATTTPKNAVLFVGSSSFARWKDIAGYFPTYNIINRGFGGSTLVDVIRYAYDIILPYQPKQVFIYAGDNDLAQGATVEDVVTRFKTLFQIIRTNLPDATIVYVSIKPSPSRQSLISNMKEANNRVEAFLRTQKNAAFVNVFAAMLNADGEPKPEIFLEDRLHMNAEGYAIWKKIMLPYLKK